MPLRVALLVTGLLVGWWTYTTARVPGSLSPSAGFSWEPVLALAAGWAVIGAAVVTFGERRHSAVLAYVAALIWFLARLVDPTGVPAAVFALVLLASAGAAVTGHLLLTHPDGRTRGRLAAVAIALGYALTIGVLGVASAVFLDPHWSGCRGCPANPLLLVSRPDLVDLLGRVGTLGLLGWLIMIIGLGAWRIISAPASVRGPISLIGVPCLGLLAVTGGDTLTLLRPDVDAPLLDGVHAWYLSAALMLVLAADMIIDLWTLRRSRQALSGLVVTQGQVAMDGLRGALAARLHDPTLIIAYPIEDGRRHVDLAGLPIDLSAATESAQTLLRRRGRELAVLVHQPGVLESSHQVRQLVASVQLGLENERLAAEERVQLADLRASGMRLVAAGDRERRRIERDLHDGARQRLVSSLLAFGLIRADATFTDAEIETVEDGLRRVVDDLRSIAHRLEPSLLREAGLSAALDDLAEAAPLRIVAAPDRRYPSVIETTVYRLVARILVAGSAAVELAEDGDLLLTTITGPENVLLDDLADRANALGGVLASSRTGSVTSYHLTLPVEIRADPDGEDQVLVDS